MATHLISLSVVHFELLSILPDTSQSHKDLKTRRECLMTLSLVGGDFQAFLTNRTQLLPSYHLPEIVLGFSCITSLKRSLGWLFCWIMYVWEWSIGHVPLWDFSNPKYSLALKERFDENVCTDNLLTLGGINCAKSIEEGIKSPIFECGPELNR